MPNNEPQIHTTTSLSTGLRSHYDNTPRLPAAHIPPRHVVSSPALGQQPSVPPISPPTPTPSAPPASAWSYHPHQPTLSSIFLGPSRLVLDHPVRHSTMGWRSLPEAQLTNHGGGVNEKQLSRCKSLKNPIWPPWKRRDGWAGWRDEWVRKDALVIPLIVQAFSAGVLDATTYADFMTFASNQTGNTILLCVSAVGTVEVILKLTAISLGAFLSAAFIFGHLGHYFGVRQRGWIMFTTTWQILTLILAAILVSPSGPSIFNIGGQHEWFILFLFAHMSGAQVAQARQSSNTELPTAPMTSSYVDLMSDKYLFVGFRHKKAGPRNRKLAYTTCMIVGGLLGACIHRWAGSWEVVVVTLLLKCVMLGMVCCAKVDEDPQSE